MSFFKHLAIWVEQKSLDGAVQGSTDAIQRLNDVIAILQADSDAFDEIMRAREQENSEVVDLAQMLQLLNHEDDGSQEQGIQLLQMYNSEEAWEALMMGATFPFAIEHSSLRMSPALCRILLQNPFYDYSHVTKLKIRTPFADNLNELSLLTALEELHLHITSLDSCFASLKGLSGLSSLKKVVIVLEDNLRMSLAHPDWGGELQHIEEIEFRNDHYSIGMIDYSFIDTMPNLKKVSFFGLKIDYQKATFAHQPAVHIYTKDPGAYRDSVRYTRLIPNQPSPIVIQTLSIDKDGVDSREGLDLSILNQMVIKDLILEDVFGIHGLHVFAKLNYEPNITYDAKRIEENEFWCGRYNEKTWSAEMLRKFKIQHLKELLENKEVRRSTMQAILKEFTGRIVWHNAHTVHKEFRHLPLKEVVFTFPERKGHLVPTNARRLFRLNGLGNLPTEIEKLQFGDTSRVNDNWMVAFGKIDHLVNLKEVVVVKPVSLKTTDFEVFLSFPNIERIEIIGGKKRKRIPKKLRHLIVFRESP